MRSRGADRPDDDDQSSEHAGRSRRLFGRGRAAPVEPGEVPQEETGWLDDLWTAKEEGAAIGPGTRAGEARTSKSGRVAPGPDGNVADDGRRPAPGSAVADSRVRGTPRTPVSSGQSGEGGQPHGDARPDS
ncbi:MAG: hypothetical protein QOE51_2091, partial [Actinoplanes sp.]|nr:hypothetical protein [Actinoplanes sp.]